MTSRNDTHLKLPSCRDKVRLGILRHWIRRRIFHCGVYVNSWGVGERGQVTMCQLSSLELCNLYLLVSWMSTSKRIFRAKGFLIFRSICRWHLRNVLNKDPTLNSVQKLKKSRGAFKRWNTFFLRYYVLKTFFVEMRPWPSLLGFNTRRSHLTDSIGCNTLHMLYL